jgi:hypothetical protein
MKKALQILLAVSFLAFALDFLHFVFHLLQEPALWQFSGVPQKFFMKALFFLIPAFLFIQRKFWLSWLAVFLMLLTTFGAAEAFAKGSGGCKDAQQLLDQSGIARDASENFFGHVKRKPPYGSFPSDMDKITWWGVFQPFEFWEEPEFQAIWINPSGQEVARQKFHGTKCRLAKSSLRGEDMPQGEFQEGMWKVIVTCENDLIDQQSFAVLPLGRTPPKGPDAQSQGRQATMIWAKDLLDEK